MPNAAGRSFALDCRGHGWASCRRTSWSGAENGTGHHFEALLFAECGYDPPRSLMPVLVQWFGVAGSAPVLIGKAYGITERVDFPFAFMHARAHLGQVRDECASLIGCVECVG